MKNRSLLFSLGIAVAFSGLVSCGKTETAVADKNDPSFKEDFDAISKSVSKGWVVANNSKPIGTAGMMERLDHPILIILKALKGMFLNREMSLQWLLPIAATAVLPSATGLYHL